ncbi:type 1 fimbria pilin [Serratia fonticola]|uniref:Type 1 fimbria pilin n=1 Tax=Serratia fonticola TaxID=47917 RepID=A0A559T1B6_SERFO|nr:fimbrial protein [Serratia fonticola]TQI79100.1 type 1 fimbria pilin [Serratia fonticola]TQI98877.1 type 1 fimbria pilin [Serratia fonticola]TVZ68402.1 type 1 fimbria pilin [Serratia fonticola]
MGMTCRIRNAVLALLLPSTIALAQVDNRNVEGMNGGLIATGELVSAPCSLADESTEQQLDFGTSSTSLFERVGTVSSPKIFSIILNGCPEVFSYTESPQRMQGTLILSLQPAVKIQFIGDAEPSDLRLFRVTGEAQGLALRLQDSYGEQLIPGMNSRPQVLTAGRNELRFQAQLMRVNGILVPGAWLSVMKIALEYE